MASSEMATFDQWSFRPSFIDPWFSEALSRETQTLTRALTKSLSDGSSDFFSDADCLSSDPAFSPFLASLAKPELQQPDTPAVSNVSAASSDHELTTPNKRQMKSLVSVSAASGKVSKRKPRASKRSQITFITADPANFRQMVQQVTGVRFPGSSQLAASGILKPEPQRPGVQFSPAILTSGCLPTLDTSAYLLENNRSPPQQKVDVGAGTAAAPSSGGACLSYVAAAAHGSMDFDAFASFPTLESWNAM